MNGEGSIRRTDTVVRQKYLFTTQLPIIYGGTTIAKISTGHKKIKLIHILKQGYNHFILLFSPICKMPVVSLVLYAHLKKDIF